MPPEADLNRLRHMLEAAQDAVAFASGLTRQALDDNRMVALAIVKSIEILGEAADKVSEATRSDIPAVAWTQIVGMRHRLIHAYFDIDLNIVWDTVEIDLPPLIATLDSYLLEATD